MNRRSFNTTGLAALLAPLAYASHAQHPTPGPTGFQTAEISSAGRATRQGGMATRLAKVDEETLFQAASCSKTVTALAILTLVRDGRVDLDLPANHYLRRWKLSGPRGETTTVAQLMSHTAGTTVDGFEGYGPGETLPSMLDILNGRTPANSAKVRTHRRFFPSFHYSGGGTMVLQALLEDVSREDFATYAQDYVLDPIGAQGATFDIRPSSAFARGHLEDGQALEGGFRRHPESAAAGLWASASDLAQVMHAIVRALRSERAALVPSSLARRMITPVSWRSGLGVFVDPNGIIYHDGRNHGFDSIMVADLKTGHVRAATTNRNGALEHHVAHLLGQ